MLAYAFSGVSILIATVALVFLKRRVPVRQSGRSVSASWSTVENASAALLMWFVLEGAAVLAAVGFLLTGSPIVGVTMALAIVAYWLCGPNTFARP